MRKSSPRTCATGILKFKIIDRIRIHKRGREMPIATLDEQSMDDAMDALFAKDGHWQEAPPAGQQPEQALQQRQFFDALQACVDRQTDKIGRVFMMRERLEQEVEDICTELGITSINCGVMLYRARMQLRERLGRHWFQEKAGKTISIARKSRVCRATGRIRRCLRANVRACVCIW